MTTAGAEGAGAGGVDVATAGARGRGRRRWRGSRRAGVVAAADGADSLGRRAAGGRPRTGLMALTLQGMQIRAGRTRGRVGLVATTFKEGKGGGGGEHGQGWAHRYIMSRQSGCRGGRGSGKGWQVS